MNAYLLKWWQTITVTWVKHTAYRMNFFLQIIGPSLVFFFIKYNLWSSIYHGDKDLILGGFTFAQMIHYHVWSFLIGLVAKGHGSWDLSEDIRMGRISSYLIYPFHFHEYHTASFISFLSIQMMIASFSFIVIIGAGFAPMPNLYALFNGILFTLAVSFFWFTLQYLIGILAFWLEETWIIRVIMMIVANFLSGAVIPLDLYPNWLVSLLKWTPFPYLSYYPIQIYMGRITDVSQGYLVLGIWFVALVFIINRVWKKGIRMYTAAGM